MPKRTIQDFGHAIYDAEENTAYCRVSPDPSPGQPNWMPGTYDDVNIGGKSFNYDNTGDFSPSWSACEVAVARHVAENNERYTIQNSDVGEKPHIFTTPYAGELRVWLGYSTASNLNATTIPSEVQIPVKAPENVYFRNSQAAILPANAPIFITARHQAGPIRSDTVGYNVYLALRPAVWPQ